MQVGGRRHLSRCLRITALIVGGLLLAVAILLALRWPFTREKLIRSLEHFSSSEVAAAKFHQIYFPHPGYVAEAVTFSRKSDHGMVKLASLNKLICSGSWLAMITFTNRVKELQIQGLSVDIKSPVPAPMKLHPGLQDKTTVQNLIADGAVLQLSLGDPAGQPVRFEFPQLRLANVQPKNAITLQTLVHNPEPKGDLEVRARFGPLDLADIGLTKLNGSFTLKHADLSPFRAIRGMLASRGFFKGTLANCTVRGSAAIPDFEVTSSGHAMGLNGNFDTVVDGLNGDVSIKSVDAHLLHSAIQASGTIGSSNGQRGKTLSLKVDADHARVEDLLRLFAKADQPALDGPILFRASVVLPPGRVQFIRRVQLDGDFKIPKGEFTHATTQQKVDELSERARGKGKSPAKLEAVASDLEGHVLLRNANAMLSRASFATVGAVVRGGGDYNLLNDEIDMRGKLAIQASLSKAAGGMKSILLLPLDPIFKKQHAGAVIPITISGTYSHPVFKVSLRGNKELRP